MLHISIRRFLVTLLCSLLPFITQSTHIVGGELYYRHLGNNDYEITLIIYRDCANGVPPFDDPASIGIFDNPFYNLIGELLVSPLDSLLLPPSITSPCFIPPVNICYRQATYRTIVNLPSNNSGYWLVYQRCCRNNSILNIVNPNDRGATYTAFIPGTSSFSQNSNPVYQALPPTFICQNIPFTFDHSALDAEGDSVVYELCTPLDYPSLNNPMPQPPFPPPYQIVPWKTPFSLNNILGGVPMTIHPQTGLLSCTPSTQGQFVFGVCAREYRNGIYLGESRRDFQVNVVPCLTIVVAALQNPILSCDDNTVTFINNSQNAGSYFWDFGDDLTTADTSHAFSPTYTYPDSGSYTVTLVAFSSVNSACNDTVTGVVKVYPGYEVNASAAITPCSPVVQFTDTTLSSYNTVDRYWDFGDGTSSNQPNPSHAYPGPGLYIARYIATSDKGCTDTVTISVNLNYISGTISESPARCYGECNGTATAGIITGISPITYQWNDALSQSTQQATGLCAGSYQVILTDSSGCRDTLNALITQPDSLVVSATALYDYCNNACLGFGLSASQGGNGSHTYQWSDPAVQTTPVATSLCTGYYTVTVTDNKGCIDTASVYIPYVDTLPYAEATASVYTLYEGQSTNLYATQSQNYIYNWFPSSSLNSNNIPDPVSTPLETTVYTVEVTDSNGCKVTDTVLIRLINVLCAEPEIFIPNAFTPNNDNENDRLFVRGNTIESMYFTVYDRWGEKVFETAQQQKGWDGIFNGSLVQPGVFVYYLKAVCYDKSEYITKGNITVIR